MNLPKKIKLCPIIDSVFEIRFHTTSPRDAIFGIVYNEIKAKFGKLEKLPIIDVPESIRAQDDRLRYRPVYKLSNENLVIQLGPEVLALSCYPIYLGWDAFSKEINLILESLKKIKIIDSVNRIALRYINFFENDVFKNINLEISLNDENINCEESYYRALIKEEKVNNTLQITNSAKNDNLLGSVIDIDTFLNAEIDDFLENSNKYINLLHETEKKFFFSLLKKEFIEELQPEY